MGKWLIERRLRQGNYVSAFAHADTLVRRRQDIQPEVFSLFTLAGVQDPQRSLPVTADLLAANRKLLEEIRTLTLESRDRH